MHARADKETLAALAGIEHAGLMAASSLSYAKAGKKCDLNRLGQQLGVRHDEVETIIQSRDGLVARFFARL